jgi:hypothetical protein
MAHPFIEEIFDRKNLDFDPLDTITLSLLVVFILFLLV